MKKNNRAIIIALGIVFVLFVLLTIQRIYVQNRLIARLDGNSETINLFKKDAAFRKVVTRYPEILDIMRGGFTASYEAHGVFMKHRQEFLRDLVSDPDLRKVVLVFSSHPSAALLLIKEYDKTMEFLKRNIELEKFIVNHPDYAHYLFDLHPEKTRQIIDSPDPETAHQKIYGAFLLSSYRR